MSIFLKNNNWLVADWVMRKLNRDIKSIDLKKKHLSLIEKFDYGEKLYTYLIDFSEAFEIELSKYKEAIINVIEGYDRNELSFKGTTETGTSFLEELNDLKLLIDSELKHNSLGKQ